MSVKTECKLRRLRTTEKQYKIFVEELENNPDFRDNKCTLKDWQELTEGLNSMGPAKDVATWKKIYQDWKYCTKKKAQLLNNSNTSSHRRLNELEVRLINVIGIETNKKQSKVLDIKLDDNEELDDDDEFSFDDPLEDISILDIDNTEYIEELSNVAKSENSNNNKRRQLDLHSLVDSCKKAKEDASFEEKFLVEVKGIKEALINQNEELRRQNDIKKMKVRIMYEQAKIKYKEFNLDWEDI